MSEIGSNPLLKQFGFQSLLCATENPTMEIAGMHDIVAVLHLPQDIQLY